MPTNILWLIVVVLIVLWALGQGHVYNLGGSHNLIYILLVIALVIVVINVVNMRRRG